MWRIVKKEINVFFSSTIGYVTIATFLLVAGLFTWVFPQTNIYDTKYASLDPFFSICPFLFLFLVPAVTMRSFAEERSLGTYELLVTKPISDLSIVVGKYVSALILIVVALVPTLLYVITVYQLGSPVGNLDLGATIGSFIGLLGLAMGFVAVGIFVSTLHDNQIVVFLLSALTIFVVYLGFSFVADLSVFTGNLDFILEQIGMNYHYDQMSRGLIDLREVVYFISLVLIFLGAAHLKLKSRMFS